MAEDHGSQAERVAAYVDLVEAERAPAHDVFAVDARDLARDIAAAEGLSLEAPARRPADLKGLIGHGLAGSIGMAGFAWFFAIRPLGDVFYRDSSLAAEIGGLVIIYGICAGLVLGGAALAMARYLRSEDGARRTVARATALMAGFGLLGVAACVALAPLTNDSSAPAIVLLYVGLVGALCSAGITLAWQRSPQGHPEPTAV